MNGSLAANQALVEGILGGVPAEGRVEMLVCPPFPYLGQVSAMLDDARVKLGSQNVSQYESGAYTGECAGSMLREMGCDYAIVGHSERRALFGESSQDVAAKFVAAQAAGLTPILCVGETLEQREAGNTEAVIDEQLDAVLDAAGVQGLGGSLTSRSGRLVPG